MTEDSVKTEIRRAEPSDAPAIADILRLAFTEYQSSYTHAAFAATAPSSDQIVIRMSEGPIWIASWSDVVVGTVSVVDRDDALYIRGMAVRPDARGRRIGELMLAHVERYAASRAHVRMLLSTTPFLTRAIRLYESFGFVRSEEGPYELFGTELFTMVKVLPTAGSAN